MRFLGIWEKNVNAHSLCMKIYTVLLRRNGKKKEEKRSFIPKAIKRRYPFDEDSANWDSILKVDVPIAKVTKHTSLPFEDASHLKDPMDSKAENLIKKIWEAALALLRPGVAATCVARTLNVWLDQLEYHLQNKTPRDQILESLPP